MPFEPLEIGVQVDISDLQKLAGASQQVASSVSAMAEKFVASGMSAKGTAAAELEQETRLIDGLIAAEVRYQQKVAATNLSEEKKAALTEASLSRVTQLQNQLTDATGRYNVTLQKIAQEQQAALEKMTQAFNSNFVQWMNGSETFAKAMTHVWESMADSFVTSLLKMGEQMILNAALQKTIGEGTKLTDAETAAANTYAQVSAIPVVGWILAPVAAAAAFAAVLAFEGGGVSNATQPVLVHGGEIITHEKTLATLSSPGAFSFSPTASGASADAMRVPDDRITMLAPGRVVVPKTSAESLSMVIADTGGTIGVAPGETPPSGIREIPQRLPSSMASLLAQSDSPSPSQLSL
jgi:hypothetical protein